MNILVIGGAGYVGSHAARYLMQAGHDPWVYDNLSVGHGAAAPVDRLIVGDVQDGEALESALRQHEIEAVMHFAAFSLVGESVTDPAKYYRNNVGGAITLLDAMRKVGVGKIVFSSTTATYGEPDQIPIPETTPQRPINPYGFTKLVVERMLRDHAAAYGISYAALRYFNAAGAAADGSLGEDHTPETHLIPLVLSVALGQRESISLFGDDYSTPDGSCVRDYIHVDDLAVAHLRALERLVPGAGLELNLGTGRGTSVRQVVEACRRVSGREIEAQVAPRREGDPAELVADASKAHSTLDWSPRFQDIEAIVGTAWEWHRKHPNGYSDAGTPDGG